MVIREAGIMFRGFNLVSAKYHQTNKKEVDSDLRSSLITALLTFCEGAFTSGEIEYFELKKYAITFNKLQIKPHDSEEPEDLIVYAIIDQESKMEKYINKVMKPIIRNAGLKFIKQYEGSNLSEISQFKPFRKELDNVFGTLTHKMDQKLDGVFF
jgi:hypothetical protein